MQRLKAILGGKQPEIFAYKDFACAHAYTAEIAPTAVRVKNTVLRRGFTFSDLPERMRSPYRSWVDAKSRSIANGAEWIELVSANLGDDDPQQEFMNHPLVRSHPLYHRKDVDDRDVPIVQMCMFRFGDGTSEVLFGWELPLAGPGPVFLSRDYAVGRHLEALFDRYVGQEAGSKLPIFEAVLRPQSQRLPNSTGALRVDVMGKPRAQPGTDYLNALRVYVDMLKSVTACAISDFGNSIDEVASNRIVLMHEASLSKSSHSSAKSPLLEIELLSEHRAAVERAVTTNEVLIPFAKFQEYQRKQKVRREINSVDDLNKLRLYQGVSQVEKATSALASALNVSQEAIELALADAGLCKLGEYWIERDRKRLENPEQFIARVYDRWLGKGLTRGLIHSLDLPLYTTLAKHMERNELSIDLPDRRMPPKGNVLASAKKRSKGTPALNADKPSAKTLKSAQFRTAGRPTVRSGPKARSNRPKLGS